MILISFSDIPFNAANATQMSDQISQSNYTAEGATGSVKDYYYDNSMGALNANFVVVGPYTLSQNQAYYGANDSEGDDLRPREMVAEACSLASSHINFAIFDNDGDNYVDMIHVVYAGRGEHNGGGANAIWAHSWAIPSAPLFNGVRAYKYSCSNELRTTNAIDGIGTICHEMGHVLGLPDFYDTDYSVSGQAITLDSWDLMSSGNYNNASKTPPYLSALERHMLGWINPITLTNNNTPCTLPAISDSNKAYKVNLTTNEFFIFEHRNKKKWDQYTPAKGMLVFHGDNYLINQWINTRINKINTKSNDRGFFIIPAYGDSSNNVSASTTFPGSQNIRSFVGSKLKNFAATGKLLLNINYGQDSVLEFNYFNTQPSINFTAIAATNITSTSAKLNGTITGTGISSKGFQYRKQGTSTYTSLSTSSTPLQVNINNLSSSTTYEYRLYAVSSIGTTYSNTEIFMTDCGVVSPPLTENFESPLNCWTNISSSTDNIDVVQSGGFPSCTAHGGEGMLKYNSFSILANQWAGLISPKISFPHSSYEVSLWIFRYKGNYSKIGEGVEVYVNSSQSLNGATKIGFISNNREEPPTINTNGWYNYTCNVGQQAVGENYIILKTISKYGYNTYIDDFSIYEVEIFPPTIKTDSIKNITHNSSTIYSSFNQGTQTILSKGLEYRPSFNNNWDSISVQNNTSPFSIILSSLIPNQLYFVRPYVVTQEGRTYPATIDSFKTQALILPIVTTETSVFNAPSSVLVYGSYTQGSDPIITSGFQYKETTISTWTTLNQTNNISSFNSTITNLSLSTTYQYRAFVTHNTGTTYGITKTFTTPTPPTISFDPIEDFCLNDNSIILDIASPQGGVYSGQGITNLNQFNPSQAGVGNYYIKYTYTDTNLITVIDSFIVKVNANPQITFLQTNSLEICQGDSINLEVQAIVGASYQWYKDDAIIIGENSNICSVNTEANYNVVVVNSNNCSSVSSYISLEVNQIYYSTITASICQGQTYTLNGFNENAAGFYTQTLQTTKGCDSIVNLSLTVNPTYNNYFNATISEGETYSLNGFNETTTGLYTQNLQTIKGCDSIISLNLIVYPAFTTVFDVTICQGMTYILNGFNENRTGIYTQYLQTINGSDSIVILNLKVNPIYNDTITRVICQGDTYSSNGFNENTEGIYTQFLQTINGCDSIISLNLIVKPIYTTSFNATICEGESYSLNGFNENITGTYTQTLQTINGCDSIVNLNLIVNPIYTTSFNAVICEGESYNLNGFNENITGTYSQTLQTINGCDSIISLNLIVNPIYTTSFNAVICEGESYNLNGFNESTTGTYTQTLQTINGCDSIITLDLIVNPIYTTSFNAVICQGETYNLNGFNENITGTYTQTLQTINGCDSIVNLNLIVNPIYTTSFNATICEGESYSLNGFNETTTGTYTQTLQTINGCDSIITLNLIVNEVNPPSSLTLEIVQSYFELSWVGYAENYIIYRGNDSIGSTTNTIYIDTNVVHGVNYCYRIKSIEGECEAESIEICKEFLGINDNINNNSNMSIILYPNPANGNTTLRTEGITKPTDVFVYDVVGRHLRTYKLEANQKELNIDLTGFAKGIYQIKVLNQTKKLIKN
ncbi:MAG TPA: M6 family metalloprotease domain-containing protein [Acholeplasmataceae bacterium]|nr:M6 family metalloprotease domain-containing protein [Acholeplasmataceae bacterium]